MRTGSLAAEITRAAGIPVIGIGAGVDTDGQVLVLHDMLGLNPRPAKFVRNFMRDQSDIPSALAAYTQAVKHAAIPGPRTRFLRMITVKTVRRAAPPRWPAPAAKANASASCRPWATCMPATPPW